MSKFRKNVKRLLAAIEDRDVDAAEDALEACIQERILHAPSVKKPSARVETIPGPVSKTYVAEAKPVAAVDPNYGTLGHNRPAKKKAREPQPDVRKTCPHGHTTKTIDAGSGWYKDVPVNCGLCDLDEISPYKPSHASEEEIEPVTGDVT